MKTKQIKMTRDLFIETMESIGKQLDHDFKCYEAFSTILPNDFVTGYDNHFILHQLIKLLEIAFGDCHKDSWIEYFIYELNFGKSYKDGDITNEDGTPIDLSTVDKLYDFLISK